MMHSVNQISASYDKQNFLSLKEGRKIYVSIIECYLEEVNTEIEIRPYLHHFPFRLEDLDIILSSQASSSLSDCPAINLVFLGDDRKIIYQTYSSESESFRTIHTELYEDAVRFLRTNSSESSVMGA